MICVDNKPIHIILRVDKQDVDYSISHWSDIKDYIWWSYRTKKEEGKSPISDNKIKMLNENINSHKSNFVFFCDDKGKYLQKAKLIEVEGKGSKSEKNDSHIPINWGGSAKLWLKCDNFEKSNFNELRSLTLFSPPNKSYINLDTSRKLYPFQPRNPVNLVIKKYDEIGKNDRGINNLGGLSGILTAETDFQDFIGGIEEGKRTLKQHYVRERNPQIIKEAKRLALERNNELRCEICGFSFFEHYGDRGKEFIEGHHKKPISEMGTGETTSPFDIALVCSNCHKAIHLKMPWLSMEELRRIYR